MCSLVVTEMDHGKAVYIYSQPLEKPRNKHDIPEHIHEIRSASMCNYVCSAPVQRFIA